MAVLPVVALVGRPNVGKSTLFNRLTRTRDAIVDNRPGVTRDRLYGRGKVGDKPFLVVDTGGLEAEDGPFRDLILNQVEQVIEEAQVVIFLVDAREGLVPQDREIAGLLRQSGRRIMVAVNKSEGEDHHLTAAEFQELALGGPMAISALRGEGVEDLVLISLSQFKEGSREQLEKTSSHVAILGRPNVGKSTLTNRLVGSDRVIVSNLPGTTRDSVRIPFEFRGVPFTAVDTAGVRRRSRVDDTLEKFSVIKTLQAIEDADVVVMVLDASGEIGAQDATILGMVQEFGRSIIVVVNKWDGLERRQRHLVQKGLERKLSFLPDAEILFVSALHGSNISTVMPAVVRALDSSNREFGTSSLNRTLAAAITQTPPPMHRRRPIRLKFAHQAGKNPPVVVVHGNQAESLPISYVRYLARYFAKAYRLRGTWIRVIPRNGKNPFAKRQTFTKTSSKGSRSRRKL